MRARSLALGLLLAAPLLARAGEGDEHTPETPARLKADLEEGARLFRQKPDTGSAKSYAQSLSYVDVDWDGRVVTVRDPWLTDAVDSLSRQDEKTRKKSALVIADHLAARAAAVDAEFAKPAASAAASATASGTPADPDAVMKGILEQRQFHAETEDPKLARAAARVREVIHDAWTKIKETVSSLFDNDAPAQSWGDIAKRIGALIVAVIVVVIAGYFVVRAILRATVDDPPRPDEEELPEAPPVPAAMTRRAEELAAGGDLRGAVRALYLALLGDLHAQGAIEYDRHRTNREYLRTMRLTALRAAAFGDAVELFDRKWYGREPCSPQELAAFRNYVAIARTAEAIAA